MTIGLRYLFFFAKLLTIAMLSIQPSASFGETAPESSNVKTTNTKTDPSRQCIADPIDELLSRSYDFKDPKVTDFPIEFSAQTYRPDAYSNDTSSNTANTPFVLSLRRAPEGGPIVIKLSKPSNMQAADWQNTYLYGLALTEKPQSGGNAERKVVQITMSVREKNANSIVLDASMPANTQYFLNEKWTIVPVLCGGIDNKVLGYATTKITSVSVTSAWILALVLILIFWALISFASWQLNYKKLDQLWDNNPNFWKERYPTSKSVRIAWKSFEACNPVFIAQDSLGFGSLARFQILVFTTVVGLVLLYIFIHSGVISNLSDTILLLLGVTVAGGTLARAAGDWTGITPRSRRWLVGTNILVSQRDKPRWSDLFETDGEMDVAKVQALLFTGLITISIFASGYSGLSSFSLPNQIVYLAMISQGAYVFGKFLPVDTRKTVEQDLEMLRKAAEKLTSDRNNVQIQQEYQQARQSAKKTLEQTYMERFNATEFDKTTQDPAQVI